MMSLRLLPRLLSLLAVVQLVSAQTCTTQITCASSPAVVPKAWYNLTFQTNPVAGVSGATYTWENTDAVDSGCTFTHQGLAQFGGGSTNQYVDLTQAAGGVSSSGTPIPGVIGGLGSGSVTDGTSGWSFEYTFRSGAEAANGKIFAIGAGSPLWNIFAGPDGNAAGATFGVYNGAGNYNNGQSGILETMNPTLTTQWYHIVAVVQNINAPGLTHGTYFVYVNGQLLNFTNVGVYLNSQYVQAVARPIAYLARSDWSADPYWTGLIDTFRIYDRALTGAQVTTLYQGEMGGCPVPVSATTLTLTTSVPNILPRATSPTAAPTPFYSLNFATDPRTSTSTTYGYGWESVSPTDSAAQQGVHKGILTLNGAAQFVDLGASSGANSASTTALPTIGGGSTGWSFELVIKPGTENTWAKIVDIGSSRTAAGGQCINDIVLGWDAGNAQWQFDLCDSSNHEYQTGDAFGNIVAGQWYHMVAVIAPTTNGNGLANYFTYINGQLYTAEANFLYPAAVARQNAWLGRSGWSDANMSAEVDTFNIYNVALSDVQVATLAAAAVPVAGTCGPQITCAASPATVPQAWYNLTFGTNPVASASAPSYGWESTDAGDNGCPFVHRGIATFNGNGQYADMNATNGNAFSGQVLPTQFIGGAGSGSLADGTQGWSFEYTFRSGAEAANGKIWAIGAGAPLWNIFSGPDGNAAGATFGVYNGAGNYNNGQSGIMEIINPVSTTQWYHIVAVVQQLTPSATHGAWFVYVNGQLLNFTNVGIYLNSFLVQPVARPIAFLARSDWSADPYWTGLLDTFRIYDRALTGAQVTTLYQGEMGGCPVPVSATTLTLTTSVPNILPRATSPTAAPTPFYSLNFATDPRTSTSTTYGYGWESVSPTDSAAQQGVHKGILTLNGAAQFVDLGASSGANSASTTALPTIGGGSTGWSFELVIKPGTENTWAKIVDIGSSRTAAGGQCINDIVLGWDAGNAQWQFDLCDSSNHEYQTGDAFGNIVAGQWYHMVAVIAPTTNGNGLANYFTYINGQLYTAEANFLYPAAVARQNAWLGRSGWSDANMSAEVDTFNIYNVALSDVQVATLAAATIVVSASCGPQITCAASPATVPQAWYNLTFTTNPISGQSGATYGWEQTDAGDKGCPFVHQGVATYSGTTQYTDMTATSGASFSGQVLPSQNIGGAGSGSLADGTMGWSFEWTFRSGAEAANGKIWSIGAGAPLWNIFSGPDGSATGANFGIYNGAGNYNNGADGVMEFANPLLTTQWYHVVAVVQQLTSNATHGAWFMYVNGQLLNFTNVGIYLNSFLALPVARPQAYLARSNWPADPYWTGLIDTFRIYDRALTGAQVTTLYQGEMGGCAVPVSATTISLSTSIPNILPRATSPTAAPLPFYSLTFATDPRTSATTTYGYGWESVSTVDSAALAKYHSGIVTLNGVAQYLDLGATSGPNSVSSTALPTIGGGSGWSFEVVIKPGGENTWAKIIDFGSSRTAAGAQCINDIVLGWDSNNAQWQFDLCDSNNHEYQTGDAFGSIVAGQWYHMVAVIAPTTNGNGLANYFTYINGQLYTAEANFLYPAAVARQNAWLGRSGWSDANMSAEVDTFNIYNVALSDVQVATLSAAALGNVAPAACSTAVACTGAGAVVPKAWYNVTFTTNPIAGQTGSYQWQQSSALDSTCPFAHQGIATFNGNAQYVDLTATSGAAFSGQTLPSQPIGGLGSGSLADGTLGWSFEWTFVSGVEASNGKIWSIGAGAPLWNIFSGPDGSATGANFGIYNGAGNYNNGADGILEFANPLLTTQWYHVVAVVQNITTSPGATHGAWFMYVNGQLLNFTNVGVYLNSFLALPVSRPQAFLARSNWPADPYWTGSIDTFRIYDRALTGAQVTSLYQGEMGGCPVVVSAASGSLNLPSSLPNLLPRNTGYSVSPWYSLSFNTDPRTTAGATYGYGWEQVSSADSAAMQGLHTGILTLNGGSQYVDLGATSGPNSVSSTALPTIGGGSGWSFELVIKPGTENTWAKIIDFGSSRTAAGAQCINDIVLGWDSNNAQWQFDLCDSNNHEYQTGDAFGNLTPGQWYHMVAVIAPTTNGNGLANYFTYINGQLYTAETNFLYPVAVARQNAWLGRSGWSDANMTAELDSFNIYNVALSDVQANNLYQTKMLGINTPGTTPPTTDGGSSSSSGLSGGAIAGIVIGSVVGALILLAVCFFCICAGSRTGKAKGQSYEDHRDVSQVQSERQNAESHGETDGVELA